MATQVALNDTDVHPRRWRILGLLALAELLGMSLWFAGNAVAPQLQAAWSLTGSQIGWLTTAVQLGFVAGTAVVAVLNLADIIPSQALFTVAAVLGALSNAALLLADSFAPAVTSRFVCGFCLAGVYPPAMKMISTWFKARRKPSLGRRNYCDVCRAGGVPIRDAKRDQRERDSG